MNWHFLAFLGALGISYLLTPRIRKLALRLGVIVHPGGRRIHSRPMPLWGGIAIFAAFTIAFLVMAKLGHPAMNLNTQILGVLISCTLIVTIGLLDDMKELSAVVQVLGIVISAIVLMMFGVRIQFITNPFGEPNILPLSPFFSWTITLIWIFAVTKTVDFMDGLDGLAAGIGAISAGVLAIMAYYSPQANQQVVALMAASLSGSCIGFLRFNFNPAKIFMGTGGSQLIGFALAAISIIGAFKIAAALAIALPVLVLGVPIFDGIFVVLKRFANRQPIHIADRSHLHHRLLERGLSHKQAVMVILFICLALGVVALTIFHSIYY